MRKLLALVLCGCAAALPPPDQPGAKDAYRAAAAGNPKDPRTREARERLEASDWDAARARHDIFAYRRFLEEYPESRHAAEAGQLLEGLRWQEADAGGSETALQGYLQDEPRGAHAPEAWSRLSALRLAKALQSQSAPALRAWLAEDPAAPGRDQALRALDEADWRAAAEPAAWRKYLDDHFDGAHRSEAQQQLRKAEREEAEALEDEPRLRALDPAAADRLVFEKALALLDEGKLSQLARRNGPFAVEAARDLAALRKDSRRAGELERAARSLYLPRPTMDELPDAARDRATRLREWALSLDGTRLHRMLSELASPRAGVALAALDGAQQLLQGLPPAEARARAERELVVLQPLAMDAPQLTALSLLQLALGRGEDALASARRAAGRDPHCGPAVVLAAKLEREPGLVEVAAQAVRSHALWLLQSHGEGARAADAAALGELCAAAEEAPGEPAIRRLLEEGARAAPCAQPAAEDRRAAARLLAGAATPLARAALARAAARDPDPDVREAAQGALAAALR